MVAMAQLATHIDVSDLEASSTVALLVRGAGSSAAVFGDVHCDSLRWRVAHGDAITRHTSAADAYRCARDAVASHIRGSAVQLRLQAVGGGSLCLDVRLVLKWAPVALTLEGIGLVRVTTAAGASIDVICDIAVFAFARVFCASAGVPYELDAGAWRWRAPNEQVN